MSSSLLESYPQMALIPSAGLFGLAAYSFATIAPVWTFGLLGPLIRRVCPDGFTLSEYIRRRFGWPVGVFSALVFIGFMFCFMIVELNTYGLIVQTIVPSMSKIIPPLVIAITTTIYTMYGGFKASLWTDNFNALVVIVFIIIGAVMFSVKLDLDPERVHDKQLLGAHAFGGELWYILTVSIVFAQMFNQGFWQRAFASKTNLGLYISVALASIPLFAICFLVGMAGPLAYWAHVQELPNDEDDGSSALFKALLYMPKWVHGLVLVLTGVLSSSAYDTFQSAQISVIQSDLFLGRLNIWWCRLLLLLLNVPCVVLALIQIDILQVFLIADLAGLAVIPAVFLGLISGFDVFNGVDVVVGGCGGFLTVFVFGTIYYNGDAIRGGQLIGLPDGLYGVDADASDYSVIGAFLAAPLGDLGFALASCGVRILVGYAYARYKNQPFTMLDKREDYRMDKYVLDEDRPVSFAHKLTNPEDGHRLESDAQGEGEFHSVLHSSHPHHLISHLWSNNEGEQADDAKEAEPETPAPGDEPVEEPRPVPPTTVHTST